MTDWRVVARRKTNAGKSQFASMRRSSWLLGEFVWPSAPLEEAVCSGRSTWAGY